MSAAPGDVLETPEAGGLVIRGSVWRIAASLAGIALGLVTAALLLRHLGVAESGRYVTVTSLVLVMLAVGDLGLGAIGTRELALRDGGDRGALIANIVGLRLLIMPVSGLLLVAFALVAQYPTRMVVGTGLAATGASLMSLTHAYLTGLVVELRNVQLAVLDFVQQLTAVIGVALLVALGASLEPFFLVPIFTGLTMLALVPVLAGRSAVLRPGFDRLRQRELLRKSLPLAISFVLGQVYLRLVMVVMSLISSAKQTGYYGGSLRAMESLIGLPGIAAGVALPLLAAAARTDRARLRYAVDGLSRGAVIAGVLLVLVTFRAARPVMEAIGGHAFRGAGDVLRIQVAALLFIALYQIWSSTLLALGRQRELILTNALALAGVAAFAAVLVPLAGAQGGAGASVLGDALLGGLIYWRLHRATGHLMVPAAFLARVALAAAAACVPLAISALPAIPAAVLSGLVFIAVGELVGMVPPEVHEALDPRRLRRRQT